MNTARSQNYVVIIPAYNEESTIVDSLDAIVAAAKHAPGHHLEKIIVCLNGCTDATEEIVNNWSNGPLKIIRSRPGYINAMNCLLRYARTYHSDDAMIKTDADSKVDLRAFSVLLTQLQSHPDLIVVGGHPAPIKTKNPMSYRGVMGKIMSIRSRRPEAEITTTDTSRFHPYAIIDPIPELRGREKKLKVYFHGRLWCARTSSSIPVLPADVIGDDVYLPGWLLSQYGPSSIRLDYRAKVHFHPNDSLIRHWKVYRRIHEDRNIVYHIKDFDEYAKACPLKLDWAYIFQHCSLDERLCFLAYAIIVSIEKLSYRFTSYSPAYWQYSKKEL